MTTLAIIGGGIAGRTLAYTLAKEKKKYSTILLFQSNPFAFACSYHSTAVVAPRGVSVGHSPLGDLLSESFDLFLKHFKEDGPQGVFAIPQFTGALSKIGPFKNRYPQGQETTDLSMVKLKKTLYVAHESGFLIDPEIYLKWLLDEAAASLPLQVINEFVTQMKEAENVEITTQNGSTYVVDEVVVAAGTYSRYWKNLNPESKIKSSKPIQGSYLEFTQVDYGEKSFSLTLEGDNLIYHAHTKKLLIGSTTQDTFLELPPDGELKAIYQRLQGLVDLKLPDLTSGIVRVGLREKASKREPYCILGEHISFVGGFYKNGYSLPLKISKKLVSHLLRESV